MKRSIFSMCIACLCSVTIAFGQSDILSWKAQVRLRSEADMRDFNNKTPANLYSLLRARLAADLKPAENVGVFLQVQDSRVLGSEAAAGKFSTLANTANLDLHQGFIRLDDFLLDGLTVQAGRMEISLGTQRFVGAVGWNNVSRSFDGIRLTLVREFGTVDVFAVNTGETTVAPGSATPASVAYAREGGQFLGGAYLALAGGGPVKLDVFGLYESNRNQSVPGTNDLSRFTLGGYARGATGSMWYTAEAAYQLGTVSTNDLSAYLVSGMVGVNLSKTGFQRVGAGADILSGTATGSVKAQTFVPAFHTGHKFYGFMDYFVGIPAQGLHDFIATARFAVRSDATIDVTGHLFKLAETAASGKDLGQELDAVASWRYNSFTLFQLGASVFLPGGVMKSLYGGTATALWGFAVLQVTM